MKRSSCAVALVLTSLWVPTGHSRNLELVDYLDWEQVSDPQLSPDGKRIVYSRVRVDKIKDTMSGEVWQMSAAGERERFLLEGGSARWSPSGDRIAYIGVADGAPQLFVRWMDAEGSVTQITHAIHAPNQFVWSPDGKWIAFRAQVPMTPVFPITLPARPPGASWTQDPPVFDRLHYRADRMGLKTGHDHLFVVPSSGGTGRQLTEGDWDVGRRFSGLDMGMFGAFDWTADGTHIVFSGEMDRERETGAWMGNILQVDVSSGEVTTLFDEAGSWGTPRVSPDGRYIAFVGNPASDKVWPAGELRVMESDGSHVRVLLSGLDVPFMQIFWADDGRGLYYSMGLEGSIDVHFIGLDGSSRRVTDGAHTVSLSSLSGGTGMGVYSDPETTPNVVSIDLAEGALTQLTDVNDDIFRDVDFGEVEEIWYGSSDNARVQGWIITPPGFDPEKRYPLILEIHGGPNGMYDVGFNFRFQEYVSQGYVVLFTNPRGSTGYGVDFTQVIDQAYPGRVDYDDLMAGVDEILGRGYIDEDRLYVTGCSGGGALTAWVIGHTDRFAAAAPLCAVTDWIGMAGTSDVAGWANDQFDPPYWEEPTKWLEHSPLMHVGKVTTPTLLITGDKDLRTPLAQAEAFYSALKRRGVPTLLIPMVNEWHGTWSIPSNMLRTQLYLRKWFEEHGGGARPDTEAGE